MGPIVRDNFVKCGDLKKFHLKPSEPAFSTVFCHNDFRLEVASEVMSGVIVDPTGGEGSRKVW